METFNIHEAKTHFSKLVDSVMQGTEIMIAQAISEPLRFLTADDVLGQYSDLVELV